MGGLGTGAIMIPGMPSMMGGTSVLPMARAGIEFGGDLASITLGETKFEDLETLSDRIAYTLKACGPALRAEFGAQVDALFHPATLAIVAVLIAVLVASHFFGVGFFIDAALIAIGFLFLGWAIFKAVRDIWKCFELVKDATSLEELDLAAVMLGKVLATLGFETLLAIVSYGVLKLAKPAANAVRKGTDAIGDWRKARRVGDKAEDAVPPKSKKPTKAKTRAEAQQEITDKLGKDLKANPLRKSYEDEVSSLSKFKDRISADMTDAELEKLAREASKARRDLGVKYKDVIPSPLKEYIYEYIYDVNVGRYKDPLGPSFDYLKGSAKRALEKSGLSPDKITDRKVFEYITESASRPNPDVDKLLSGFDKWLSKKPDDFIFKFAGD